MPRTKHARKLRQSRDSLEDSDLLVKDFERQLQLQLSNLEAEAKMSRKGLETVIDLALSRLPPEIRRMTFGEILKEEDDKQKENCNQVSSSNDNLLLSASTTVKVKKAKRVTAASDDGYVTESAGTVNRASRAAKRSEEVHTGRRTRSSSRNSRAPLSETNQLTVQKAKGRTRLNQSTLKADKFKTPAFSKNPNLEFGTVTPKIKPNTPMNVLRRPRQGETVISMQGSPLLVSAIVQERIANINVPLSNGNVMSLLPNDGLRMSHIPALDPETMRQLETLKNHIEKVITMK